VFDWTETGVYWQNLW